MLVADRSESDASVSRKGIDHSWVPVIFGQEKRLLHSLGYSLWCVTIWCTETEKYWHPSVVAGQKVEHWKSFLYVIKGLARFGQVSPRPPASNSPYGRVWIILATCQVLLLIEILRLEYTKIPSFLRFYIVKKFSNIVSLPNETFWHCSFIVWMFSTIHIISTLVILTDTAVYRIVEL